LATHSSVQHSALLVDAEAEPQTPVNSGAEHQDTMLATSRGRVSTIQTGESNVPGAFVFASDSPLMPLPEEEMTETSVKHEIPSGYDITKEEMPGEIAEELQPAGEGSAENVHRSSVPMIATEHQGSLQRAPENSQAKDTSWDPEGVFSTPKKTTRVREPLTTVSRLRSYMPKFFQVLFGVQEEEEVEKSA